MGDLLIVNSLSYNRHCGHGCYFSLTVMTEKSWHDFAMHKHVFARQLKILAERGHEQQILAKLSRNLETWTL